MGREPARRVPAGRRRDAAAGRLGRRRSGSARVPVTNAQYHATTATTRAGDVRLARRGARRSASGRASGCRRRSSGRPRRAAATTGSGRGATSCRTGRARTSRPASASRRRSGGIPPARRRAARSTWPGNVWEWTADGGVRGGSLPAAGRTSCAARSGCRCTRSARDPYVGFRVVGGRAARRSSTGSTSPPASTRSDGTSRATDVVHLAAFELSRTPVTNAQYAPLRRGDGRRPAARRRPAPDDHPVTFVDWRDAHRVLRLGRRPAADRGRVGEGGARHRRTALPVGRRAGRDPRERRRRR